MVCPYCSGNTHVTNARPQKRTNSTWRRRQCEKCQAIFTTREVIDPASVLRVSHNTRVTHFSPDKLFVSIYESCRHRKSASTDAGALAQTIMSKLMANTTDGLVPCAAIRATAHDTLLHFDATAAAVYAARHAV